MSELGKVLLVRGHVWWNDTHDESITNTIVATMGSLMSKHTFSYREQVYTLLCESGTDHDVARVIWKSLIAAIMYDNGHLQLTIEYARSTMCGEYSEFYTYYGDTFWFKGWLEGYEYPEPEDY